MKKAVDLTVNAFADAIKSLLIMAIVSVLLIIVVAGAIAIVPLTTFIIVISKGETLYNAFIEAVKLYVSSAKDLF